MSSLGLGVGLGLGRGLGLAGPRAPPAKSVSVQSLSSAFCSRPSVGRGWREIASEIDCRRSDMRPDRSPRARWGEGGLSGRSSERGSSASMLIRAQSAWCVVRGAWCVVRGAWCVVRGAWCVVRESSIRMRAHSACSRM